MVVEGLCDERVEVEEAGGVERIRTDLSSSAVIKAHFFRKRGKVSPDQEYTPLMTLKFFLSLIKTSRLWSRLALSFTFHQ